MNAELKYKWRVPRDAWFIRLYVFAWSLYSFTEGGKVAVDEKDINFCKLFWGYLLMPAAFLVFKPGLHLIDGLIFLGQRIGERRKRAVLATDAGPTISVPVDEPERPERRSGMLRILDAVGQGFVRLSLRVQAVWLRIRRPVLWTLLVVAAVVALAATGVLVYFIAENVEVFLRGLLIGAAVIGALTVAVLVVFGLNRVGFWAWLKTTLRRGFRRAGSSTKAGTLGFVGVMRVGYHAVKTNTCPEIVLSEEQRPHRARH